MTKLKTLNLPMRLRNEAFAKLIEDLENTTATQEKLAHLENYFRTAPSADSKWALSMLLGQNQTRAMTSAKLKQCFLAQSTLPEWLLVDCHAQVGDTAETISLLKPYLKKKTTDNLLTFDLPLHVWMTQKIPLLKELDDPSLELLAIWNDCSQQEIFVLNKILAGGFRIGVSHRLVIKALASVLEISFEVLTHRLMGEWSPNHFEMDDLKNQLELFADVQPYPFCLAHEFNLEKFSELRPEDYYFEFKLDGIRAQVVKRGGQVGIWSRGEDLIQKSFPDLEHEFGKLDDGTVIDGEIVVLKNGEIQNFQSLQQRLGRKKVSAKVLQELPAGFVGYDCLEVGRTGHSITFSRGAKKAFVSNLAHDVEFANSNFARSSTSKLERT